MPVPYDRNTEDDWVDGHYDQAPQGEPVDLPAPAPTDDEVVAIPNPVNAIIEGQVAIQLPKIREWGISQIRTYVGPYVAAAIITWLLKLGINIDSATANVVVFAVASAGWYAVMRGVELASKSVAARKLAGLALGIPRAPIARVTPTADVVEVEMRPAA